MRPGAGSWIRLLGLSGLALLAPIGAPALAARPGVIEFSDGQQLAGQISLTPGKQLQLLSNGQQRAFGLDRVREIRLAPETELLERAWRFREAGKADKEFWGDPYPVRHLQATVLFADHTRASGHLFTTVLYVETNAGTRKVILYAKQRGDPKQTLAELVYPAAIRFADAAADSAARLPVTLLGPDIGAGTEVAGVAMGSLVGLAARPTGKPGEYEMAAPMGEPLAIGYRNGDRIVMGWPAGGEAKLMARVRAGLADAQDFFDGKQLLGVWHEPAAGNLYSLLLLSRQGQTTMGGPKTQPWRLSVWRWKYDPGTDQLLLAGRCDLFREITERGAVLPVVQTNPALWQPTIQDGRVKVEALTAAKLQN